MVVICTTTHPSLLLRVRDPRDHDAWSEFDRRYGELILRYCLSRGLQRTDAEDVRQTVLLSLMSALPRFEYEPSRGRFRGYLGRVVHHAIIRHRTRGRRTSGVTLHEAIDERQIEDAEATWQEQWTHHHLRRALRTLRQTSRPQGVQVFEAYLAGATTPEVARRLGMSVDAVQKAKERVRLRLTEILERQIAEEDGMGAR